MLDLKGQLADMEEIKADLEGHVKDLSQELAAARQAAEKQASERTAALQVGVQLAISALYLSDIMHPPGRRCALPSRLGHRDVVEDSLCMFI